MRQIDFYQIGQAGLGAGAFDAAEKDTCGKKESLNPMSDASGKRP
jgi:hypothetical protein